MNILYIYTALPKGGIETFFLRITKKLSLNGHKVKFLFFTNYFDENLLNELKQFAEIFSINDFLFAPQIIKKGSPISKLLFPLNNKLLSEKILYNIDHIHAPDFNSILFVYKITNRKNKIPISTGVYHINEFNFTNNKNWNFVRMINSFLQKLPSENILFFNEICKEFYNEKWENKFIKCTVTPIGIEISPTNDVCSGIQNNRIVSIGRFDTWKTYNFSMIEVIRSLKEKGMIFYYDSYGGGRQYEHLKKKVLKLGLEELVTFHPGVPYSEFKTKIVNKLMFIGAGTALIEASATGIPAMIGIENEEKALTYGFLHNTTSYSYQENQLNYERIKIEFEIIFLKNCNEDSYFNECEKAKIRAQDFSIDKTYSDFILLMKNSKNFNFNINYFKLIYIVLGLTLNKICFPKSNYSKRL